MRYPSLTLVVGSVVIASCTHVPAQPKYAQPQELFPPPTPVVEQDAHTDRTSVHQSAPATGQVVNQTIIINEVPLPHTPPAYTHRSHPRSLMCLQWQFINGCYKKIWVKC